MRNGFKVGAGTLRMHIVVTVSLMNGILCGYLAPETANFPLDPQVELFAEESRLQSRINILFPKGHACGGRVSCLGLPVLLRMLILR